MQTPPLSFDPIFMEDAQCAETNKNSIFRFLRFIFFLVMIDFVPNLQVFLPTKYGQNNVLKRCAMF